MLIVDAEGYYAYQAGTKTLDESDHPVYQARIEIALGVNTWLYAPASGHDLDKYKQERETSSKIQEFQKDLTFYLEKYGPLVTDLLVTRGAVSLDLKIAEGALNV